MNPAGLLAGALRRGSTGYDGAEPVVMEKYNSFSDLFRGETAGVDYRIIKRTGDSGLTVMSIHGGGIEPGTTEIADAVAGKMHSFYSFSGTKTRGNKRLHITSTRFDEPVGLCMVRKSDTVLTIHGCREAESVVYIGGKNMGLGEKLRCELIKAGFTARPAARLPGMHPQNICNLCRSGTGVQLEISTGLRREMFAANPRMQPQMPTRVFNRFVSTMQNALQSNRGLSHKRV
jgi:phage replication-related protein YjqB (UPF0714/DUF867 family)